MGCLELKLVLIRICSRTVLYLRSFNLSALVDYVCAGFMICVCFSDAISCSFISPFFYVFVQTFCKPVDENLTVNLVVKLLVHLYWCWNKVTFSISGNLTYWIVFLLLSTVPTILSINNTLQTLLRIRFFWLSLQHMFHFHLKKTHVSLVIFVSVLLGLREFPYPLRFISFV